MTNVNVPGGGGSAAPSRFSLIPLLLAVAVVLFLFLFRSGVRSSRLLEKPAPDIRFSTPTGEKSSLSSLRGNVVLVNFWASWCGPCVSEMPSLRKLEDTLAAKGLIVLAVGVDERWEQVKAVIQPSGFPTRLAFVDNEGDLLPYRLSSIPVSVLIDKAGVVRDVFFGPRDWASSRVVKEIETYLKEH